MAIFIGKSAFAGGYEIRFPDDEIKKFILSDTTNKFDLSDISNQKKIGGWSCKFAKDDFGKSYDVRIRCTKGKDVVESILICFTEVGLKEFNQGRSTLLKFYRGKDRWAIQLTCDD